MGRFSEKSQPKSNIFAERNLKSESFTERKPKNVSFAAKKPMSDRFTTRKLNYAEIKPKTYHTPTNVMPPPTLIR